MLKTIVVDTIGPMLKQHKFRKKGFTWNRKRDGMVQVVNFQQSRFNTGTEVSFTINVGICDQEIWTVCWEKDLPAFISILECFPSVRIGELISPSSAGAIDKWWAIGENTDLQELGNEIVRLLADSCIPFLESILDRSSIADFCLERRGKLLPLEELYLAIVRHKMGDESLSEELLLKVEAFSESWEHRVKIVRSRL